MKKLTVLVGFLMSTALFANDSIEFRPGPFIVNCNEVSGAWRVYNPPKLTLSNNILSVKSKAERLRCVQLDDGVTGKFVRAAFNPHDAIVMLDWSRGPFSLPGRVAKLLKPETGLSDFDIRFPLNEEFLTNKQLKKIEDGEIVTKELTFYYGKGSESSDSSDTRDYRKSVGYYLLKFNVRKNTLRPGLAVGVASFQYMPK